MTDDKKKGITRRDLFGITGAIGGAALLAGGTSSAEAAGEKKGKSEPLPQVPRKKLGKCNETIPILVMGGSMDFDQRFDPKFAECMRFGVNYFDMADCYAGGTSETAMGNYMARAKNRDKLWLTSKSDAHDPAGFEKTVNTSLKKMKTNRVDLYYMHALKDPDLLNKDIAKTAEKLKKEGKIRFFGFSCHSSTVVELLNKAATLPWIDSIMFRYNFRQYGDKALNKAIDACAKANIGLIAMKTQGSEASFASAWKKYKQTGKWNKHQAVLKAVWADERIASAVSHMDTFEKLKQNIAAACDKAELSQLEQQELHKYAEATRSMACDGCDHICNPHVDAPVQIGTTMRYLMYHEVYGQADLARELFEGLPPEARNLDRLDFRAANAACPHKIDIAHHMERASKLFA